MRSRQNGAGGNLILLNEGAANPWNKSESAARSALLLAISGSLIASIVVNVTVTVCLTLSGTWLVPRSRAAVRHSLLITASTAGSFGAPAC